MHGVIKSYTGKHPFKNVYLYIFFSKLVIKLRFLCMFFQSALLLIILQDPSQWMLMKHEKFIDTVPLQLERLLYQFKNITCQAWCIQEKIQLPEKDSSMLPFSVY